jgi:hypothetical protein
MKNIVTYHIDPVIDNSEVQYVFNFAFNSIGIKTKKVDSPQADVCYGNLNYNAPVVIRHNDKDTLVEVKSIKVNANGGSKSIEFDIINSIRFFILDIANQNLPEQAYDKHERVSFEGSYQYKHNIYQSPIVNELVGFFEGIIKQAFPDIGLLPRWPNGKRGVILLSHDVDNPVKHANLMNFFKYKENRTNPLGILQYGARLARYILDAKRNEFWLFKKVAVEEAKYGFKSTFFFASKNRFEAGASPLDVDYNIESKAFKKVFRTLKEIGSEIGLHASYNAYQSVEHFMVEKKKLEVVANTEVKGLRHHYWHMTKNMYKTLEMHSQAGFKYDCSIAFNNEVAFRYNVALPFYPYGQQKQALIECMQLPTFCMDMALFNKPDMGIDEGMQKIKKHLDAIRATGGIGAVDWHEYTSYPSSRFQTVGSAYVKLLSILDADYKDLWVPSCAEAYGWISEREKKLRQN